MRSANLISLAVLSAALCAGLAEASRAQGGWRQWEIRLRDGRRLQANPLGAPDDAHLSLSVGGYDSRDGRIARSVVHVVAALPLPDSLPAAPVVASCEDAIVRRDGTRTVGRIILASSSRAFGGRKASSFSAATRSTCATSRTSSSRRGPA
jgi:hypothetical protein